MIVYADRDRTFSTQEFLRRIRHASDPRERFILEGQFESAVADVLCADADDEVDLCRAPLPDRITVRQLEGYAFYGVYPELYQDAALRFLKDHSPQTCVVVGIRSIGASLSKVVAETVHAALRVTVRPRGDPFNREVRLSPALTQRLRWYAHQAWFLIVDEGPGLSGSSFMGVAAKLEELGVPRERIVLLPSHNPNPDNLVSERARKNWRRYRCYVEPFPAPGRFVPPGARDISGGAWRELLFANEAEYPAAQPQHERRKYLHGDELWKFSGLALFGRARQERAMRLKGFIPPLRAFQDGFLVSEWAPGRPARLCDGLLDTMARYLAFLRSEFPAGESIPGPALEQMIEHNLGQRVEAPMEGAPVAIDGRMLPHEWLDTEMGYLKADALDHHDDHFFPGSQDIAWDIAGAAVEWGFPVEALADRYLRLTEDPALSKRLPFYRTAYRAYRYGYCQMAAETLGDSPDGQRFRRLQWRYVTD